jgi:hypothetical protein
VKTLTYVSLGAGVQSSALLVMSALGLHGCPKADVAVFADTGDEAEWTYHHLNVISEWAKGHSRMEVWRVQRGQLSADPVVRVPAYVDGPNGTAPLTQNCTRDYKLTPIRQAVRKYMAEHGIKTATAQIGISLDEADRMKPARMKWLTNSYPLVDARLRAYDCATILRDHGFEVPRKSACVFCPWRSDAGWRDIANHDPEGFQKAIAYDDRLTRERGATVHRSRIPLRLIDFTKQQSFGEGFTNECEGVCGV